MWLKISRPFQKAGLRTFRFKHAPLARGFSVFNDEVVKLNDPDEEEGLNIDNQHNLKQTYKRIWPVIDQNELKIYQKDIQPEDLDIVQHILEGRALSNIPKSKILEVVKKLSDLDMSLISDKHLYLLLKWIGTSTLRRYDNKLALRMLMNVYDEIRSRGTLDDFLLVKEDPIDDSRFDPKRYNFELPSETIEKQYLERAEAAFVNTSADGSWLLNHFDILVSFSNIGVYLHELFISARYWLLFVAEREPKNEAEERAIYMNRFRAGNYVWGYLRLCLKDSKLFTNVFLKHMDLGEISNGLMRSIIQTHMMAINYMFTPPAAREQAYIKAINIELEKIIAATNEQSFNLGVKQARMLNQIILALYPEVSSHIRDESLHKAYASDSNPFAKHYRTLNKLLMISSWIISQNHKAQGISKRFNMTYFEGEGIFQTSCRTSFLNKSKGFEHKVIQAFLQYGDSKLRLRANVFIGGYEVDLMTKDNVAIEINSTTHFIYKTTIPMISQQVKNTQLELLGVPFVKHVNYFEAQSYLDKGPEATEQYIRKIIDEIRIE